MKYAISPIDTCNLERGKKYEISNELEDSFHISGGQTIKKEANLYCLKKKCAHIKRKDWMFIEA